jgi:phosphoribosyl-ATP pyrophosphohydrolase/phosphoribosyl-AMP cyclohydrolase
MGDGLRFDQAGLIPAVVQDVNTGRVLMLGYQDREAFSRTLETGRVWFYSRSRQRLWQKGETSGNELRVRKVLADCDGDAVLILAEPAGPTCHTGAESCFFDPVSGSGDEWLPLSLVPEALFRVILDRQENPRPESYVSALLAGGIDRVAQKVGEEAVEAVIAAKNDDREALARELADLWFHSLVLMAARGLRPADVWAELARRHVARAGRADLAQDGL